MNLRESWLGKETQKHYWFHRTVHATYCRAFKKRRGMSASTTTQGATSPKIVPLPAQGSPCPPGYISVPMPIIVGGQFQGFNFVCLPAPPTGNTIPPTNPTPPGSTGSTTPPNPQTSNVNYFTKTPWGLKSIWSGISSDVPILKKQGWIFGRQVSNDEIFAAQQTFQATGTNPLQTELTAWNPG